MAFGFIKKVFSFGKKDAADPAHEVTLHVERIPDVAPEPQALPDFLKPEEPALPDVPGAHLQPAPPLAEIAPPIREPAPVEAILRDDVAEMDVLPVPDLPPPHRPDAVSYTHLTLPTNREV